VPDTVEPDEVSIATFGPRGRGGIWPRHMIWARSSMLGRECFLFCFFCFYDRRRVGRPEPHSAFPVCGLFIHSFLQATTSPFEPLSRPLPRHRL
jgi:hypothetical protein